MTISPEMEAILVARGLDPELLDRLGLKSERRAGGECVVIPFRRSGETVRRKYRWFDREENRWTQDKGGIRCAYNEDCLRDDTLIGQPLIITEGEFDAIAAIQAGFPRTISVPDGAPPPGERSKDELDGSAKYAWVREIMPLIVKDRVSEIIIAADGDENGGALLQDLSALLGRARCKFLTYPKARADRGRERCKDLNEVLEDYGSKGIVETLNRAAWIRMEGVYRMSDLPPLPPMVVYEPRNRLFAENFKARLGDFSVVTGTPTYGKTSFVTDLFCGIAMDNRLTVAWGSFEQEPQWDHKRNLRAWFCGEITDEMPYGEMIALADRWIDAQHVFMIPSEDQDATLDWMLEQMEQSVIRYGASIVVIDPWNELEHNMAHGETETQYTSRAIRRIKRFAKAFRVHVCIVAHPTKNVKGSDGVYLMPTLYDIAGSANWYNKADLGLIVHRPNQEETLVKVQKSRYHDVIGKPGEVLMHFNFPERRFVETERPI